MVHIRSRHASEPFEKLLKLAPLVGVFGHRQVGKTTFLEQVCTAYSTFDKKETLLRANSDAEQFLNSIDSHPHGIDECQLCPDLFPALKELVRTHKKPGQIVLSGSVRFYSRKAIRESLTGRLSSIDMLPFCLTELLGQPRSRLVLRLSEVNEFHSSMEGEMPKALRLTHEKVISAYSERGGLPGVCFLRNEKERSDILQNLLSLLLDRDLRLVYPTSLSLAQILEFAQTLAKSDGRAVRTSQIRKLTGISEQTQKKLLAALESIFVIRQIPIEGGRKGVSVFFEDQAEQQWLHGGPVSFESKFETLVYRNLRASFNYEFGLDTRVSQFLQRPDLRIPFVFKTPKGSLGIIPYLENHPSGAQLRSARKYLQQNGLAKILMVSFRKGITQVLEPRLLDIPAERILFSE